MSAIFPNPETVTSKLNPPYLVSGSAVMVNLCSDKMGLVPAVDK